MPCETWKECVRNVDGHATNCDPNRTNQLLLFHAISFCYLEVSNKRPPEPSVAGTRKSGGNRETPKRNKVVAALSNALVVADASTRVEEDNELMDML